MELEHHAREPEGRHLHPRADLQLSRLRRLRRLRRGQLAGAFLHSGERRVERVAGLGPRRAGDARADGRGGSLPALVAQDRRLGLQPLDDGVDLFAGRAHLIVELGLEPAARRQLAILHRGLAGAQLALVLRQRRAFLGDRAPLGLQSVELLVHTIEVRLQL
jgi:hypothetical protein